jgi:glucose/arabinose dehydrogenase
MKISWAFLLILPVMALAENHSPLERVPNTTLRMPVAPPVFGFATEMALGGLSFPNAVAITSPPGETNRLFILEQRGVVSVVTNLANPTRTVFMDISGRVLHLGEQGLLGIAFHPEYEDNRQFYLFYTSRTMSSPQGNGMHAIVARFETSPDNPNQGLPDSETPLISQFHRAGNHNGGDLHFGPDGYLYISVGDEGGGNDQYNNSQFIDKNFFSAILRIDVDNRPESIQPNPHPASHSNYSIPADNPFIGATRFNGRTLDPDRVRTEIFAIGLRNPWRISFDPATGLLYAGDVGQSAREEINIIVKGGNYGWAFREGTIARPGSGAPPSEFEPIDPIQDYIWGSGTLRGRSVTGGVVYRGERWPHLRGAYIFGDYVSGNIWSLRYDGAQVISPMERLLGSPNPSAFGIDPSNGDVLITNHAAGRIVRLTSSSSAPVEPLPETLSETGIFSDLQSLEPHPGIVPYEVVLAPWSDQAQTKRWFSIPDPEKKIGFSPEGAWSFPPGTVWVKHFSMEMDQGNPESLRRLETRVLVQSTNSFHGATYRWNEEQTEALLVPEWGLNEDLIIQENGVERTQTWRYPSRTEIVSWHTSGAGLPGFQTAQLNRDFDYDGQTENQLRALSEAGYFDAELPPVQTLRALAHVNDDTFSREYRVRSYLHVNCSACHLPGGVAPFDARITTKTTSANLIEATLRNNQGNPQNRVIARGAPEHSMMLERISTMGPLRMPPGSTMLDADAINLLHEWIVEDLPDYLTFTEWQTVHFGSSTLPEAAAEADPDGDGATNTEEFLTGTDPLSAQDRWRLSMEAGESILEIRLPRLANRGFEIETTPDLNQPDLWKPLNHPANRPFFFSATNLLEVIQETMDDDSRFYRVLIFEP